MASASSRVLSSPFCSAQRGVYIWLTSLLFMLTVKSKDMEMSDRFAMLASAAGVQLLLLSLFSRAALGSPQVPGMFVFGDSLVDTGNSNYLATLAKSNYYPYGIDFTGGPSGRFSNGKTIVDIIGDMMGTPAPPAYADPATTGSRLLGGCNYATAAAGILDETGQHYGQRFTLSQQVLNFESNLNLLRTMMNATMLSQFLAKSLVVMVFGSNDYINNYLMPALYASSYLYTPPAFANLLLNRYTRQILALRSLGLRKFFLAGIGPLGCIPNQRATGQAPPDRCVDKVNEMLGPFNEGLRELVTQLNSNHPGAIFVYGNSYSAAGDMLNNPATFGFNTIDWGCCGIGRNQGQITCIPMSVPCPNRNEYAFWDGFHPTQAATTVLAQRAYSGPPLDCYPINILQMSLL